MKDTRVLEKLAGEPGFVCPILAVMKGGDANRRIHLKKKRFIT